MTELEERLRGIVGGAHVLAGKPASSATSPAASADRPQRSSGRATARGRAVLAACFAAGIAVVPQGGNTGLVGGGVPRGGEVVLSLARLDALGPLDPVARQIIAGAGVTLARRRALPGGLAFGVDLGARDAATLGGMVATNAGGAQVLRHGTMRARVAGSRRCSPTAACCAGSPGCRRTTPATTCRRCSSAARARSPSSPRSGCALVDAPRATSSPRCSGSDAIADAVALIARLRGARPGARGGGGVLRGRRSTSSARTAGWPPPFADAHAVYLLVECAAARTRRRRWPPRSSDPGADVAIADDTARRARAVDLPRGAQRGRQRGGRPAQARRHCPARRRWRAFAAEVAAAVERPAAPRSSTAISATATCTSTCSARRRTTSAPTRRCSGWSPTSAARSAPSTGSASPSGRWLRLTRSPAEIAAMRRVKGALDPAGILNPGACCSSPGSGPRR